MCQHLNQLQYYFFQSSFVFVIEPVEQKYFQIYNSTKWTRANWLLGRVCPKGTLTHLYATLLEETSKQVFINVHAGSDTKELNAEVKFKDVKINQKCDKIFFPPMLRIEDKQMFSQVCQQDFNPIFFLKQIQFIRISVQFQKEQNNNRIVFRG